jgi:pimeloyl-ACP methyl ester carboxylesterase/DNA-binding CsgD family transcriptional regulator
MLHAASSPRPAAPPPPLPPLLGAGTRPSGLAGLPARQDIRFVRADDGTRLALASHGVGPTLVKTATWLSHLEADRASPVWRHLLDGLARGHRFVRYDERGCGLSDWQVPSLAFERWVDDLHCIVQAQGPAPVALLGVSQGAAVAIAYAARHPERVSRLVLHGGYARGRSRRGLGPAAEREGELMCQLAEIGWGREEDAFRQFFTSQFIPGGTPEQHRWFNDLQRLSTSPSNAAQLMREFNTIDVTAELGQVRCPTLVLHSQGDLRVPFDEGRLIAGGIPGARFVPIASHNHLLLEQEPGWAQWLAEVQGFLAPTGEGGTAAGDLAALTPRQNELVELMAQGRDNAQIAAVLGVAEKTVRNHITAIFSRLEVENRAQAIVLARKAGFGSRA